MIQPWHRRSRRERLGIITLALAAISVAIIGLVSYAFPVLIPVTLSNRHHAYCSFSDGLVRLYHYQSNEPMEMEISTDSRRISFRRQSDKAVYQRVQHAGPDRISHHAIVSTRLRSSPFNSNTVVKLTGVRTTVVLPVVLLLVYPVLAVLQDSLRRRRQRPGICVYCQYDMTGNTTGVCPECGRSRLCWSCGVPLGPSTGPCCPQCGAPAQSGNASGPILSAAVVGPTATTERAEARGLEDGARR
ncbi:MAG: hypothetical protein ACE5E5_07855 [Phycisphaerae bacterium]